MSTRLPVHFISHGGGPWPWVDHLAELFTDLKRALEHLVQDLPEVPRAILMISAHWDESEFRVSSGAQPGMIYDYGGIPPYTYCVRYPAPGDPVLAERVHGLIPAAALPTRLDTDRGYDHGTFVPLAVMFPDATIPVVQVSLLRGLDPGQHLALGKALAPLRDEGVLIIGSGLSYHNLAEFDARGREASLAFDTWLQKVLTRLPAAERANSLRRWSEAPAARKAHPREEHLLPLMVAVGAAGSDPGKCDFHQDDVFGAIAVSNFRFGA